MKIPNGYLAAFPLLLMLACLALKFLFFSGCHPRPVENAATATGAPDAKIRTLQETVAALRAGLADLSPAPVFERGEGTKQAVVRYRTEQSVQSTRDKTGAALERTQTVAGPTPAGFLLLIWEEPTDTPHAGDAPQVFSEHDWLTYFSFLGTHQRGETEARLCCRLSYGRDIDERLLNRVAEILRIRVPLEEQ